MQKQRFLRGIALWMGLCMGVSLALAQERRSNVTQFDFECENIGELADVSFDMNKIEIVRDFEPHNKFISPEWEKGRNEQYPVGYQAGSIPKLAAKFQITCPKTLTTPNAK